jgi:hypothetical protein
MATRVRIARQIGEHGLRARERALGADEPAHLAERDEERREHLGIDQIACAKEPQAAAWCAARSFCRIRRRRLRPHQLACYGPLTCTVARTAVL